MRSRFAAAAATLLFCGPALAAGGLGTGKGLHAVAATPSQGADHIQLGTVTSIDSANTTFACHWKTGDWTYEAPPSVTILKGHDKAAFADLHVGQTVQVLFHFVGKREIANLVVIEQ